MMAPNAPLDDDDFSTLPPFFSEIQYGIEIENSTDADFLRVAATHSDQEIRASVADNPACPAEVLMELAKDSSRFVQENVAFNPNTPPETLSMLASNSNLWVRSYVASNKNTPGQALMDIALMGEPNSQAQISANENAPEYVLKWLAENAVTKNIRMYATENWMMTDQTKWDLIRNSGSLKTLQAMANSEKLSEEMRAELFDLTDDCNVRVACAENACSEALMEKMYLDEEGGVRSAVVINKDCPESLLWRSLRNEKDNPYWLTLNPMVPEPILYELTKSDKMSSVNFRLELIRNSNCSERILMTMVNDDNDYVLQIIAQHKSATSDVYSALLQRLKLKPNTRKILAAHCKGAFAMELLMGDSNPAVKFALSQNPNLLPFAARALAVDVEMDKRIGFRLASYESFGL